MTKPDQPIRPPGSEPAGYPDPDALDCNQLVELVTEYLDGALEPTERVRLERHLTGCDGCTTYIEQVRQTIAAMPGIEPEPASAEVFDRLVRAYREFRGS